MSDADGLRISDREREAVVARLRQATGEGRITLDEFSERVGDVFAARTVGELALVTADLPVPAPMPTPTVSLDSRETPPPSPNRWVVAVMGGATRKGRWRVGETTTAVAVMGGVVLDFREAQLESTSVDVEAWAVMGGIEIVVPEGIPVEVDGFVIMGGTDNRVRELPTLPGAPIVRVHVRGWWGGVTIRSKPPKKRESLSPTEQAAAELDVLATSVAADPPPQLQEAVARATTPAVTPPAPGDAAADGTMTILFSDIEGSAALAERLGDRRWLQVLHEHNELVRTQVAAHAGNEVKAQGDGFMVTFPSARRAVLCAIDIQRALATWRDGHPDEPIQVRIGIHTGEVVRDKGDFFGRNVILAARIAGAARGGEVLVSSLVHDLAWSAELPFGTAMEVPLKGYEQPFRVHAVAWRD